MDISTLDPDQSEVLQHLYDIIDPEIGVNVVDLGLVRGIDLDGTVVTLTLTLTTPACPLQDEIEDDVSNLLMTENVASEVKFLWEMVPAWGFKDLTPDGISQLQALGFNVNALPA